MEEAGVIAIGIIGVVLLIVIFSALTKKKELNQENQREHPSSSDRIAEQNNSYTIQERNSTTSRNVVNDVYSSLLYYVNLDNNIYGPFTLEQLKTYPLLEETLITTNTLNGSWYEAKYFECLDDLFHPNLPFRIDADGVIIRFDDNS